MLLSKSLNSLNELLRIGVLIEDGGYIKFPKDERIIQLLLKSTGNGFGELHDLITGLKESPFASIFKLEFKSILNRFHSYRAIFYK